MKQSEKEFLELIVKFYSTITGMPEDYIKSNNIIKNHIDLESTDSHFITSLKVLLPLPKYLNFLLLVTSSKSSSICVSIDKNTFSLGIEFLLIKYKMINRSFRCLIGPFPFLGVPENNT